MEKLLEMQARWIMNRIIYLNNEKMNINKEIDMEHKFKPFDLEAAKAGAPRDDARRSSGEDSRVRPEGRR